MQRFDWIDTGKSVLIFLIVLGHFHYMDDAVFGKDTIYAIHVPGFLIITGFLLSANFGTTGFVAMLRRWIGTYVRAYIFFSVFAIALWWAADLIKTRTIHDPLAPIFGSLYGVAGSENALIHADQPLWYLPYLVSSMIGAWVAARLAAQFHLAVGWIFALAYASVAILYHGVRLPWDIDIAGMGSVLIFFGYRLRHHYPKIQPILDSPLRAWAAALLLGGVALTTSMLNGSVNINGAEFGNHGALFLVTAICGSLALFLICSQIPPSSFARVISINTLTIFAIHIYLVRIAARLPHLPGEVGQQVSMIVFAAAIVFICLPLARGLKPFLDRLVNRQSPAPQTLSSDADRSGSSKPAG